MLCRTAADFDKWSWSNQVGAYQTYIYVSVVQLSNGKLAHCTCRETYTLVPVLGVHPSFLALPNLTAQGETASSWLTLGSQFMNPAST